LSIQLAYPPFLLYRHFQSCELFRVVVGPEESVYHLHKQTLANRCPYFAGLHSFRGLETVENTVALPDIPVRAFKVFITFIYGNVYHIPTDLSRDEAVVWHAEVYIMADGMCMTDLRTLAFNKLKQEIKYGRLSLDAMVRVVEHIFDNTPDRSTDELCVSADAESGNTQAVRTLLVKLCCYNLHELMKYSGLPRVIRRYGELAVDMLNTLQDLDKVDYEGD
jgi:hypothetical protein